MIRLVLLLPVLALAACGPSQSPGRFGFRSSSSTEALDPPRGPPVTTPLGNVAAPMAGISRSCTPNPAGLTAECRAY